MDAYALILLVMLNDSSGFHGDNSYKETVTQVSSFTIKSNLSVTACFKELNRVGDYSQNSGHIYTQLYNDDYFSHDEYKNRTGREVYTLLTCQPQVH